MAVPGIEQITRGLLADAEAADFRGWDPFDGLNSKLFRRSGLYGSRLARLAWIQFHKRSPVNLRPVALVPRSANPKGIALYLLGISKDFSERVNPEMRTLALRLGSRLLDCRLQSARWPGCAWGYNFDWQARAFFVPQGTPNAITTCYVARALMELADALGDEKGRLFRDAAHAAAAYLDHVHYSEGESGPYYQYIPGEKVLVHNASLWVAAVVATCAAQTGDERKVRRALTVMETSVHAQRDDGAWQYGERDHHRFVDGFHTGYNLEAIQLASEALQTDRFSDCLTSGWGYYERKLLLADGTARYFDNSTWPLDTHSFAQAVLTSIRLRRRGAPVGLVHRIVESGIRDLYLAGARRFVYQRHRRWINRVDYMRWTQAWAFYALRTYLREMGGGSACTIGDPREGGP